MDILKPSRGFVIGAAIVLVTLALASIVQAKDGIYIGAEGGYSWYGSAGDGRSITKGLSKYGVDDFRFDLSDDLGNGGMVGGGAGYQFGNMYGGALRIGGLYNYRWGPSWEPGFEYASQIVHDEEVVGNTQASGGKWNEISSHGFMLAVDYDIRQASYSPTDSISIYPTIGIGLGVARNSIRDQRFMASGSAFLDYGEQSQTFDGMLECRGGDQSDWGFAWHGQFGIGADIGDRVSASILGRYADLGSVRSASEYSCNGSVNDQSKAFTKTVDPVDIDLTTWEALANVRVLF